MRCAMPPLSYHITSRQYFRYFFIKYFLLMIAVLYGYADAAEALSPALRLSPLRLILLLFFGAAC